MGLRGSEDVLGLLLSAIGTGQAVQFPHRPSRTDPYTVRTVEPWGVVTEKGRWYLVGHDLGRKQSRVFRLGRMEGNVRPVGPAGVSPAGSGRSDELVSRLVHSGADRVLVDTIGPRVSDPHRGPPAPLG